MRFWWLRDPYNLSDLCLGGQPVRCIRSHIEAVCIPLQPVGVQKRPNVIERNAALQRHVDGPDEVPRRQCAASIRVSTPAQIRERPFTLCVVRVGQCSSARDALDEEPRTTSTSAKVIQGMASPARILLGGYEKDALP